MGRRWEGGGVNADKGTLENKSVVFLFLPACLFIFIYLFFVFIVSCIFPLYYRVLKTSLTSHYYFVTLIEQDLGEIVINIHNESYTWKSIHR